MGSFASKPTEATPSIIIETNVSSTLASFTLGNTTALTIEPSTNTTSSTILAPYPLGNVSIHLASHQTAVPSASFIGSAIDAPYPVGNTTIPTASIYPSGTKLARLGSAATSSCSSNLVTTTTIIKSAIQAATTSTASEACREIVSISLPASYGLAYTVYHNPFNQHEDPDGFAYDFFRNFPRFRNPGYLFSFVTCGITLALDFSTQLYIDGRSSPIGKLPGHNGTYPNDLSEIAVVMQGYMLVPATGTYKFKAAINDYGFLWVGKIAFDPWSVKFNQTFAHGPDLGEYYLEQGEVVPMAALWANTGGSGQFTATVTLPDGTEWNDLSKSLLTPLVTDPWFPTPWLTTGQDPAVCPEPQPVYNYRCGSENSLSYYRGKGKVVDETAARIKPVQTSYYPASNHSNCQAAERCREDTLGCWFALYHIGDRWRCVSYGVNIARPPPFTVEAEDVVEALGFGAPCLV